MRRPSAAVLDWLERLVAFDTTSRGSNLALIDAIAEDARALGLPVHVFPTVEGDKANLVVSVPAASGSVAGGVLLAGHTDCVPVDGQAWSSDPFTLRHRDGLVYGRGTADMKGFLAVILAALPALTAQPLAEPVHLGFTYDEEVGCLGAQPFVAALDGVGIRPRVAFVGEPTSMRMIRGHKSINLVHVDVWGVAAHSSLTRDGVNAIEFAAEIVRFWQQRCATWQAEGPFDEAYPIAHTTGAVTMIEGGTGVNIIPAHCRLTLEFRSIGGTDDVAVVEELRAFCGEVEARMRAQDSSAGVSVSTSTMTAGLSADADAPAVALGLALGLAASEDKVTYGTEAGIYAAGGMSAVVCGPGDIAQAHKPDEFVSLDQLAAAEAFVGRLVEHLRAGVSGAACR